MNGEVLALWRLRAQIAASLWAMMAHTGTTQQMLASSTDMSVRRVNAILNASGACVHTKEMADLAWAMGTQWHISLGEAATTDAEAGNGE